MATQTTAQTPTQTPTQTAAQTTAQTTAQTPTTEAPAEAPKEATETKEAPKGDDKEADDKDKEAKAKERRSKMKKAVRVAVEVLHAMRPQPRGAEIDSIVEQIKGMEEPPADAKAKAEELYKASQPTADGGASKAA